MNLIVKIFPAGTVFKPYENENTYWKIVGNPKPYYGISISARENDPEHYKKYPHLYRAGSYGQTVGNRGKAIFSYNPDSDLTSTGSSSSGSGWSPS